jgi:FkbM family methyltransferase
MDKTSIIFEKNYGRSSFRGLLDSTVKAFSKARIVKSSLGHLAKKRRQLAIFAFDAIGININEDGVFELHELDAIFEWLATHKGSFSKSCALDLGANIGNHSLYFSDHFKKVISFEPNKRTFKLLDINADLARNIECHNYGLSDYNGTANLLLCQDNTGSSSISSSQTDQTEVIDVRRLDDCVSSDEAISLIKIDVEGHEYEAISGAKRIIEKNEPVILFEQQPQEIFNGSSKTIDLLRGLGYSNFAVLERWPSGQNGLAKVASKLLSDTKMILRLTDKFDSTYYSLIVAIPNRILTERRTQATEKYENWEDRQW